MPGMPDASGLVNFWTLEPTCDHGGRLRDRVSGVLGTFTRATAKTIYDASTGRIHDVSAGCIAAVPFATIKTGGRGWAYSIEEARTNSYKRSAFDLDTNGDGFADDWSFAADASGVISTGAVYGRRQTISYVGKSTDSNATVKIAYQDGCTGIATNNVTTSSYRVSSSSGVTAVQRYIEAHDAAHSVLGTFAAAITDTATLTRGSGTYSNLPTGTLHVESGIRATGVDENDTVTVGMEAAQNEVGAFATSYIPTTTAAATRNADVLTVPTTGWSAAAGTWVLNIVGGTTGGSYPLTFNPGSANQVSLANAGNGWSTTTYDNTTTLNKMAMLGTIANNHVIAARWGASAVGVYQDGVAGTTATGAGTGVITTLPATARIGSSSATANFVNGLLGPIAIYNVAKTDAEVAAASTAMEYGYAPNVRRGCRGRRYTTRTRRCG